MNSYYCYYYHSCSCRRFCGLIHCCGLSYLRLLLMPLILLFLLLLTMWRQLPRRPRRLVSGHFGCWQHSSHELGRDGLPLCPPKRRRRCPRPWSRRLLPPLGGKSAARCHRPCASSLDSVLRRGSRTERLLVEERAATIDPAKETEAAHCSATSEHGPAPLPPPRCRHLDLWHSMSSQLAPR